MPIKEPIVIETPEIREKQSDRPIAELLQSILQQAIDEGATDVHLDPIEGGKLVRFRVDGVIHEKPMLPYALRTKLLNQVKVACNFDIAKSFTPMEGSLSFFHRGSMHDVRVTIVPVGNREAIHLRFSNAVKQQRNLRELGMDPEEIAQVQSAVHACSGLVLVAGTAGSGKSTTLYALAELLDVRSKVVVSIEDPVEFRLPHIRQLQVDTFHQLEMKDGLRVLLRMNPDVILVGEIRDEGSAVAAGRAALTGCLVLGTIHSTNAPMAVDALHHLSVPRYVIGAALRLVVTQELIRRACVACARRVTATPEQQGLFTRHHLKPPPEVLAPVGCKQCNGYGYRGRVGVFEVARVPGELQQAIAAGQDLKARQELFHRFTNQSLSTNALQKAAEGVTTMAEASNFCFSRSDHQ